MPNGDVPDIGDQMPDKGTDDQMPDKGTDDQIPDTDEEVKQPGVTKEYWIQLEIHPWDVCPNNIDRLSGLTIKEIDGKDPVELTPDHLYYKPLIGRPEDPDDFIYALIYRRYKPPKLPDQSDAWTVPDDRKVNPWDLNEPDPIKTQGTIPGPTLECNVGDKIIVHFKNFDIRHSYIKDIKQTVHSMHPHGFLFNPTMDGAYPLSPPDKNQPLGNEKAYWEQIGVKGFKKGDRVPPLGTFTYVWDTLNYPTTAGVWLYHDHSICDMDNVQLGAIGFVVIHNQHDPNDVINQNLPGGSYNGSVTESRCIKLKDNETNQIRVLPHDLDNLIYLNNDDETLKHNSEGDDDVGTDIGQALKIGDGPTIVKLDKKMETVKELCLSVYRRPPVKAQYLLLFHNLTGVGMCINGRKYMGNTPTVIAGPKTKMRFGIMGMGNMDGMHTFHLHGHRWVIPGPHGKTPADIQKSTQISPTSQFEDTRIFGPANTFAFTIDEDSFMGAHPPGIGEWHMHCHVLNHMMDGMMGSLLVVKEGSLATKLPTGEACPGHVMQEEHTSNDDHMSHEEEGEKPKEDKKIYINTMKFEPPDVSIPAGTKVIWHLMVDIPHTTTSDNGLWDSGELKTLGSEFEYTFSNPGLYKYHCSLHQGMNGTVNVT